MKKKILAVLLALCIVAPALASCDLGKKNEDSKPQYESAEEQTTRRKKGNKTEGDTTDVSEPEDDTTGGSGDISVSTEHVGDSGDISISTEHVGDWDGEDMLEYTYRVGATELGSSWNPHILMSEADEIIYRYVTSPFVDVSIKSTGDSTVYQWIYEMATSVTDVTAQNRGDLTKYGVTLPAGKTVNDVNDGYVFEIALNRDAKWENGEGITASQYVSSMQWMLNPEMLNSGAVRYYSGIAELAGAYEYINSDSPIYSPVVPPYSNDKPNYSFDVTANDIFLDLNSSNMTLAPYSFATIKNDYGNICDVKNQAGEVISPGATYFDELSREANFYGVIKITNENKDKVLLIMDQYLSAFGLSIYNGDGSVNEEFFKEMVFYHSGYNEEVSFSNVGLYAVDDYTLRYVCKNHIDFEYFLDSLRYNWLVYIPVYADAIDNGIFPMTSYYGRSKAGTVSCGPYKIDSFTPGEQIVLVRNENWYGYEKNADGTPKRDEDGNFVSFTNFLVDGRRVRQFVTTKIQIDVMTEDAMKYAFLKGELSEWAPPGEEVSRYSMSDRLILEDEEYIASLFIVDDINTLQYLDESAGNKNSVVLSNDSFRRALSLAINRAELATASPAYKPSFTFMNSLYHYDLYNDPESSYRRSKEAMQAIVELYGVEYGEDKTYRTLEEAYYSITGYNLYEAKRLMKAACAELEAAGLYTAGEPIHIRIAWSKGDLTGDDKKLVVLLNRYVNDALAGSGFGSITFEAVGKVDNRYNSVYLGEYAMGYGAWGGDVLDPFSQLKVYCDASNGAGQINWHPFWDPSASELTINVGGEDETRSFLDWSYACQRGEYADADLATKLKITASLEAALLELSHYIPLFSSTKASLVSYQLDYYTYDYNIMCGFGGVRLLKYNYDDASWMEAVLDSGGQLNYAG